MEKSERDAVTVYLKCMIIELLKIENSSKLNDAIARAKLIRESMEKLTNGF